MTAPMLRTRLRADGRAGAWLRGAGLGIGLALLATVAKAGVTEVSGGDVSYLLLFAIVAVGARARGALVGVVAALTGALIDTLVFQAPAGTLVFSDPSALARLLLFLPTSLFVAVLIGQVGDAERRAHDAAQRWNALLDKSPDATLLTRASDGVIIYASDRWADLGWSRASLIGEPIARVLPAQAASLTEDEAGEPLLVTLDTPDGRRLPVELLLASVDLDADGPGLLVSARDVSERMATQNRLLKLAKDERSRASELGAVIASIDDAVAVIDAAGAVTIANDAFGELAGGPVRTREDVLGVLGLPADSTLGGPEATIRQIQPGPDRWLEVRTLPVAGNPESDEGSQLLIVRDVTSERQAQAAREAFIGVLSHELRTPITTILGLSTLLNRPRASLDDDQRREVIADVASEAERLHHLVEDLLVLSRTERSELRADPEPVLLRHAIDRVVEADRRRYPHVEFVVSAPPGLPPVAGDRTFVEQVLRNLVGNAAKYSPLTPSTVQILVERGVGELLVRVLDEGPGFDAGDEERLFDLFFRSDRTAKQRAGAGIGLYVTRSLVNVMGGRAWARLRPEGGSEFGFALPILSAVEADSGRDATGVAG